MFDVLVYGIIGVVTYAINASTQDRFHYRLLDVEKRIDKLEDRMDRSESNVEFLAIQMSFSGQLQGKAPMEVVQMMDEYHRERMERVRIERMGQT